MRVKNELLLFSKKEIIVILALLVLVALFSFTLGVRLGRSLVPQSTAGAQHESGHDEPPLAKAEDPAEGAAEGEEPVAEVRERANDLVDSQLDAEVQANKLEVARPVATKYPSAKPARGVFALQVGSHKEVGEATAQVSELKKRNLDAYFVQADVPGVGKRFRVAVGKYSTKEQAEAAGEELKKSHSLPDYIVQKITEEVDKE
jgi:cell division septation protein DedD